MNPLTHTRIKVHDFVVTNFLKKSGWALETADPLPLRQHVVVKSGKLARLLKEGRAELWFEKKAWEELVAEHDGSAEAKKRKLRMLKRERDGKAKRLQALAKEAREKAADAQRLLATDAGKAALRAKQVDELRREGAKLQNDIALLQRQIDVAKPR